MRKHLEMSKIKNTTYQNLTGSINWVLQGNSTLVNVHIKIRKRNPFCMNLRYFEYHKGGRMPQKPLREVIKKKKEYLSKIQKEFLQLILVFVKSNTKNWSKDVNKHFTRDIQKSINLRKNGKPFNSRENENENQKYHLTSEHKIKMTIQLSVRIQNNGNSHTLFMGMWIVITTLGNWRTYQYYIGPIIQQICY